MVMTRSAKIARQTEYKDITGDITADQGLISGYLNTFHHVDFQQDRTLPGAFKKSLSEATARRAQQNLTYLYPLLFSHDFSQPVLGGVISANEDHHGLFVTCQMDMNSQRGREMFESCKNSFTSKFSMGFKCINSSYETDKYTGKTVRNLLECQLLEASLVTFPANDLSQITQVKGRQEYNSMLMRSKDFNSNYQQSPYVQEGVSLGFSSAPTSAQGVYMMSMAGAFDESKSGYLSANNHATIKEATQNIMKHARSIQKVSDAMEAQRRNSLQGYPIARSTSSAPMDFFEQKEAEEEQHSVLKRLADELEISNNMRELRKLSSELGELQLKQVTANKRG